MSSPHVAGAAALALANGGSTSSGVTGTLINNATTGKVTGAGTGSPNRLLYTGTGTVTPPPAGSTYSGTVTSGRLVVRLLSLQSHANDGYERIHYPGKRGREWTHGNRRRGSGGVMVGG